MEKVRACPCGNRLKPSQEKYCSVKCKGRYHKDPPKTQGFGLKVPEDKTRIRAAKGLMRYLDDRQLYEVMN